MRKFDRSLEEAALNLGASRGAVLWTITLPYLSPALIGSGLVAFLISFENFNTTLMLVGSDPPLTITMYDRMKEGSTPVLNAVSLFLMIGSAALGPRQHPGAAGSRVRRTREPTEIRLRDRRRRVGRADRPRVHLYRVGTGFSPR